MAVKPAEAKVAPSATSAGGDAIPGDVNAHLLPCKTIQTMRSKKVAVFNSTVAIKIELPTPYFAYLTLVRSIRKYKSPDLHV